MNFTTEKVAFTKQLLDEKTYGIVRVKDVTLLARSRAALHERAGKRALLRRRAVGVVVVAALARHVVGAHTAGAPGPMCGRTTPALLRPTARATRAWATGCVFLVASMPSPAAPSLSMRPRR